MINVQELIFNQIFTELKKEITVIDLSNEIRILPNGNHLKKVKKTIFDSNKNILLDLHSNIEILIVDNEVEKINFVSKADNFSNIFESFFHYNVSHETSEYIQLLDWFETSIIIE